MSNIVLRTMRERSCVTGQVLAFALVHHAVHFAASCEPPRVAFQISRRSDGSAATARSLLRISASGISAE
jgi:hypothetical protein